MTPRETVDPRQQLTPARGPLPPQRWGFLPTEEFWSLAALTPISFGFWLAALFFHDWLVSFGLLWWQNGLCCMVFVAVWAGLMERWSRKFFIIFIRRRRVRALSSPEGPLDEAGSEPVPAQEPQRRLPVVATSEFWDYAFERLFGRAKGIAAMLFELTFFMAAFYPSWRVFFGSFAVVLAISLGLGWWQRRLLRSQLEGARAGAALVDGASRPARARGDDRRQVMRQGCPPTARCG